MRLVATIVALAACSGRDTRGEMRRVGPVRAEAPVVTQTVVAPSAPVAEARLPRQGPQYAPSLVEVASTPPPGEVSTGTMLADVDSCSTCHPDVAAQWSASAHSFASFGNPSYRANINQVRADLGKVPSLHCGGCHDMPLTVDGLMTADAPIPPDDLRSHSGVTCRLCHGIERTTHDGNGSYVWDPTPIDAPELGDVASIARHKAQVSTKSLGTEVCVGCHRGFLSPDMDLPVHLTGVDEPGWWRSSAYTGNGLARIDSVEKQDCLDCHMEREPASKDEVAAKDGTVRSHRFVGGHTWMAAMRGDTEQLRLTRAKLEGAASIDVAGARVLEAPPASAPRRAGALDDGTTRAAGANASGAVPAPGRWHLPAERTPVVPGSRIELDVVIRNLLVGHRFPGGLLDVQDTWIEVEVHDRRGMRLASSGLRHATDRHDDEAHVLKTLTVDQHGNILDEHQVAAFRTQVQTHTLAPREARAIRYAFDVPRDVQLPLAISARLRHRSRALAMQEVACAEAKTAEGQAFLAGARGARDVTLDPCAPQPITLVAETRVELGGGKVRSSRPLWERMYEHGMALGNGIVTRQDEAKVVLEAALAHAADPKPRAMIAVQLGWVAAKQGRSDDALAWVATARTELARTVAAGQPVPNPPVLDAIIAEAFVRLNQWDDALVAARACTERAPQNAAAWGVYARVLVAVGDHGTAATAAARGLELNPRDPDLLRSQATALAALRDPRAPAAQAAYVRFRAPEEAGTLRIRCAKGSDRCLRDRNPVHTIELRR